MDQLMQVERPVTATSRGPYVVTYRDHVLRFWVVPTRQLSSEELRWIVLFAGKGHKVRLTRTYTTQDEAHTVALDCIQRTIDRLVLREEPAEH